MPTENYPQIIAVNLQIPGIFLTGAGGLLWGVMFKKVAFCELGSKGLLSTIPESNPAFIGEGPSPIQILAVGGDAIITFKVTDPSQAQLAIAEMLGGLSLLPYAEIAWADFGDKVFRPLLCPGSKPVTATGENLYLKWLTKAADLKSKIDASR